MEGTGMFEEVVNVLHFSLILNYWQRTFQGIADSAGCFPCHMSVFRKLNVDSLSKEYKIHSVLGLRTTHGTQIKTAETKLVDMCLPATVHWS